MGMFIGEKNKIASKLRCFFCVFNLSAFCYFPPCCLPSNPAIDGTYEAKDALNGSTMKTAPSLPLSLHPPNS